MLPIQCCLVRLSSSFSRAWRLLIRVCLDRGQGLNNAVRDIAELLGAIKSIISGHVTLETGITSYENAMRPRGARDVELSLEAGKKMRLSDVMDSPFVKMGFAKQDTWNYES